MKQVNVIENALIVGGLAISLNMIYSILGIIILVFQIAIILGKLGITIKKKIEEKKYEEIVDAVEDAKNQLESLQDKENGKQ